MLLRQRRLLQVGIALLAITYTGRAHADDRAVALLKEIEKATTSLQTLTADITLTQTTHVPGTKDFSFTVQGTVKLKKPNLALIVLKGDPLSQTIASDGKTLVQLLPNNRYVKSPADPKGRNLVMWAVPINLFFTSDPLDLALKTPEQVTSGGKETIDGVEYDVVSVHVAKPVTTTTQYYFRADRLITRIMRAMFQSTGGSRLDIVLSHVKLDQKLADSEFAYTLPPDALPFDLPTQPANATQSK